MTEQNTYRVFEDGEIVKLTDSDIREYATRIAGYLPESLEEAKETIEASFGDPLADSICFSLEEAEEISNTYQERNNGR